MSSETEPTQSKNQEQSAKFQNRRPSRFWGSRSLPVIFVAVALLTATMPVTAGTAHQKRSGRQLSPKTVAPRPPMGWNSWDCYGPTVTEAEVKANADYMARHLSAYGWKYIVVDIQWYEPLAKAHGYRPNAELVMDGYGRLLPAINRFPSAAGGKGFKPLADYVHSLGLKFGLHIMRGIPRQAVRANLPVFGTSLGARSIAAEESICPWNTDMFGVNTRTVGGQAYYDSIVKLYADWGVDYIKADDMTAFSGKPADEARLSEIKALGRAIKKNGRPIVLSLSPGPASVDQVDALRSSAQLWRIADDFWDRWEDLKKAFDLSRNWSRYTDADSFPDADMLPLGRIGIRAERGVDRATRFTRDEQITLMTLWAIFRSPLMFGGDLPSNDAFTLSLLTNAEVLAVNQHSRNNRELFRRGNQVAWMADAASGPARYLAVFNLDDDSAKTTVTVSLNELGLRGRYRLRDLWQRKTLGIVQDQLSADVNRHGAQLYKLTPVR